MLKCITFDGDASTLNALMGYFEKLDKALADVHEVLHKEQTEQPVFVREGSDSFSGRLWRLCEDSSHERQTAAFAGQPEAV